MDARSELNDLRTAVSAVFGDTKVSQAKTRERLEEIKNTLDEIVGDIDVMLDSLDEE